MRRREDLIFHATKRGQLHLHNALWLSSSSECICMFIARWLGYQTRAHSLCMILHCIYEEMDPHSKGVPPSACTARTRPKIELSSFWDPVHEYVRLLPMQSQYLHPWAWLSWSCLEWNVLTKLKRKFEKKKLDWLFNRLYLRSRGKIRNSFSHIWQDHEKHTLFGYSKYSA